MTKTNFLVVLLAILMASSVSQSPLKKAKVTPTPGTTPTPIVKATPIPATAASPTATASATPTTVPTPTVVGGAPYPAAPACSEHSTAVFHTLWNSVLGCHYDHEHGESPFTAEVAAAFPGFDLEALLGGVQIGHTNPTSPAENSVKHGGFKWQVDVPAPQGCTVGFESATYGIDAAVIQVHTFGQLAVELEGRNHSSAALLRQCMPGSDDYGYGFIVIHQDYGQRVAPYQNSVLPYPDNPTPYQAGLGPYWSLDCFGSGLPNCRTSLALVRDRNLNVNSTITSKGGRTGAQTLFNLLMRVRDNYDILDSADTVHPFTYAFICGGEVYVPAGCRYNNSTGTVHEISVRIPDSWDGLAGWDMDPREDRVTVEGYVNQLGQPTEGCQLPGITCFQVKLIGWRTGHSGAELSAAKCSDPTPVCLPERDLYFANGQLSAESQPGAVPSGWLGQEN